jgi:predicted nucleotidyltransferase
MNRITEFHIYKGTINDKLLNEKHTVTTNNIFGTIVRSEAPKSRSNYTTTFHLNHPKHMQ